MRYETIYDNLIEKRLRYVPEGYAEEHHIKPRSLGGSDTKDNLVRLMAREHYLAHYLLMKMQTPKSDGYYSMVKAFLMMQVQHKSGLRYIPGYKFENLRKIDSERKSFLMCGDMNPSKGKKWICNPDTKHNKLHDPFVELPEGYCYGKDRVRKTCIVCGESFVNKARFKTCSDKCRTESYFKATSKDKSGCTKLTWKIVDDIRSGEYINHTNVQLSKMFNVSTVTIHYVKTNKNWTK